MNNGGRARGQGCGEEHDRDLEVRPRPHDGWGPGEVKKPWFLRVNATTLTDIDVLNIERGLKHLNASNHFQELDIIAKVL